MNTNRSGHSEMRDPDWYSRTTDRAKLSPSTLETESLQNSLTSFNNNSFADLDHYSVRSLPVLSSGATIATAADAPWNESPRSLRTKNRRPVPSQTNAGLSPLDQLQNSISSITSGGLMRSPLAHPPLTSIITEVVDEDESSESVDLNVSMASIRIDDNNNRNNEMDATAHAGNVSRRTVASSYQPVSPMRTSRPYYPQSPMRAHGGISSDASYAGSSITSRGSMYQRRAFVSDNVGMDEPSLSTLGDGSYEDDDNIEIIKLLRKQVETLKKQLINEQEKHQALKRGQVNSMNSVCSSSCFAHDNSSEGDSFGGDEKSVSTQGSTRSKLEQAESGIFASIQSLKESMKQRTEQSDQDLMDELVVCELENHARTFQREHESRNRDLIKSLKEQKARVKTLEQKLGDRTSQ